jgi:FKBP-type peptidyl-prolyl cis-trans isomerase FkpA
MHTPRTSHAPVARAARFTFLAVAAIAVAGCSQGEESTLPQHPEEDHRVATRYAPALEIDLGAMEYRRFSGLYVQDIQVGDGARADSGDIVFVHYTGWLPNGRKFDSSRDSGRPFDFALGYGRVVDGWDQGVVGMRVGGQRRLVIPPALGYGATGKGPIPGNATLVFDVELLDVEDRTPEGGSDE